MTSFTQELQALTRAVARRAVDVELERQKARRTCRSLRIFEDNNERVLLDMTGKPPRTMKEIGASVGLKLSTVRSHIQTLKKVGKVRCIEVNLRQHLFVIEEDSDAEA